MKKSLVGLLAVVSLAVLGGCDEYEQTPTSSKINATDISDAQSGDILEETVEKKEITKTHTFDFKGNTITFETTYGINQEFASSWYYTIPNDIDLTVQSKDLPENMSAVVNNLYSDITLSSEYSRYNGMRQDSLNLSYSDVSNGGLAFDNDTPYSQSFQVEGVNQSEVFLSQWNGYGNTSYHYVTENDVRKYSDGVIVRVVWTIGVKEDDSDNVFSKTFTDKVYIKSPEYKSSFDSDD